MDNLPKKYQNQIDSLPTSYAGVIDGITVREISDELKQKMNMPANMDMDAEILLEQMIVMIVRMYLSKDSRTNILQ